MTHGGARPGAGRKKMTDTVPVCWRISKETNDWIRSQAEEHGVTVREIIDELVKTVEDACQAE